MFPAFASRVYHNSQFPLFGWELYTAPKVTVNSDLDGAANLVPCSEADISKFNRHTDNTLFQACEYIKPLAVTFGRILSSLPCLWEKRKLYQTQCICFNPVVKHFDCKLGHNIPF